MYSSSDLRSLIPNKISLEFLIETDRTKRQRKRESKTEGRKREKLPFLNNVHYVDS